MCTPIWYPVASDGEFHHLRQCHFVLPTFFCSILYLFVYLIYEITLYFQLQHFANKKQANFSNIII